MNKNLYHTALLRSLTSRSYETEHDLQQMQDFLMEARGMDRVCVSTGVSNTPARRLYESVGFKIVNKYLDYVKTE